MPEQVALSNVVLVLCLDPETKEIVMAGPYATAPKGLLYGILESAKDAVRARPVEEPSRIVGVSLVPQGGL